MTSSAEPKLQQLLNSGDACGSLTSSYLRSVLESAFAFGGAFGLLAGYLVDRIGRKPVAIAGLLSMVVLSGVMTFAQTLAVCACIRFVLGALSAGTGIAGLCMLGDLCRNRAERVRLIAPLPFLLASGSIFNGFQEALVQILEGIGWMGELNATVSAQVVGGLFAFFVAMSCYAKMEETSPLRNISTTVTPPYEDDEKTHFLGQEEDDISPAISVVDCDQESSIAPGPVTLLQLLRAPSLIILLVSVSFVGLYTSSYSLLVPSLLLNVANPTTSCSLFSALDFTSRILAAYLTMRVLLPRLHCNLNPSSTCTPSNSSLIAAYRMLTLLAPIIYTLTFTTASLLPSDTPFLLADTLSALLLLAHHTLVALLLTHTALLVLAASPDTFSTGSVAGLITLASLLASTAAAAVGAGFWVAEQYQLDFLKLGGPGAGPGAVMWAGTILIAGVAALVARAVREGVSVGEDFEGGRAMRWVGVWDVEGLGEGVVF